jgi:lipid-A-disaccharide synthase
VVFVSDRPLKFALVAGEASGDVLGASLIQALKRRYPDAEFLGIGGPKMIAAGLKSEYDQEKLAVRGAAEVLSHLPEILSIRRGIVSRLKHWRPNVFIGIDAPDFNLTVERKLKASGIPTVHYVSPTVWAWRRYTDRGLHPVFVGHPLADEIDMNPDRALVRQSLKLPEASPLITLMPGSRQSELAFHAELFIDTANRVAAELPDALFLVPLATPETRQLFETALRQFAQPALKVKILFGHAREALAASDLALVCSGTATLEAALLRCPMVITYKVTAISAWIYRKMRYLTWVGLPNILLGRLVVQELLQEDATPEKLSTALIDLWRQPNRRKEMEASFAAIHTKLRQNSSERAADAVVDCLKLQA